MIILAWVIFVVAIMEAFLSPVGVGKERKPRTALEASISLGTWGMIAVFVGLYLF